MDGTTDRQVCSQIQATGTFYFSTYAMFLTAILGLVVNFKLPMLVSNATRCKPGAVRLLIMFLVYTYVVRSLVVFFR